MKKENSPWGLIIEKYLLDRGINKIDFCDKLGMAGAGQPFQKWKAGAKPSKSTLEKIAIAYPVLHELILPTLSEKFNYTSEYTTESAIKELLSAEPKSDYNISVNVKALFRLFYNDIKIAHENIGERLSSIKPIIDTL